jgi:16S rRNA (cytosine1402-N4)-methyltransferase
MQGGYHQPVLVEEVCAALAPPLTSGVGDRLLVDVTLGGGGHSAALLERLAPSRLIGLDRDPDAIAAATDRLSRHGARFHAIHAPFGELSGALDHLGVTEVAGILADLGVSSHQLDTAARGFSFQADAPLDMRMDPTRGPSAAELLGTLDHRQLTTILRELGEEPDASRIARAILHGRPQTTFQLVEIVTAAMSAPQRRTIGKRINPATRTFQALRIHVNDELGQLDRLLHDAPERLALGGRLAIITFHSLEDRAVKRRFAELSRAPAPPPGVPIPAAALPQARFRVPDGYRHGQTPTQAEQDLNPRSRSSRLRVLERAA